MDVVKRTTFNGLHGGFIVFNGGNQMTEVSGDDLAGKTQHFNPISLRHLDVGD